jgi:hypothetical protein
MRTRTVVLLALCTLTFGGCCRSCREKMMESAVEKAVESGGDGKTKAKIDLKKGSFTISDGKGGKVDFGGGGATKLPDTWPKDVPVYAGVKLTFTMATDKGASVTFESAEAPQKILDYYKATLLAQGWKSTITSQTDQGGMAAFEKKDVKRSVIVTVSSSSGKTTGSLSAAQN